MAVHRCLCCVEYVSPPRLQELAIIQVYNRHIPEEHAVLTHLLKCDPSLAEDYKYVFKIPYKLHSLRVAYVDLCLDYQYIEDNASQDDIFICHVQSGNDVPYIRRRLKRRRYSNGSN